MLTKEVVEKLAKEIIVKLKPFCKKIHIAGSILRRENVVHQDIDIVLIPKDRLKLEEFMKSLGKFLQGGEHESTWFVDGVRVELYYTTIEEWGAGFLSYALEKGHAIGLRRIAKSKGYKLNNHGLWKGDKLIESKDIKKIYKLLGKTWKTPRAEK